MVESEIKVFEENGIYFSCAVMNNGEKRFRMNATDGSSCIRTVANADGGWQFSHMHKCTKEVICVQSGWVLFVERKDNNNVHVDRYTVGDVIVIESEIVHNIYMSPLSVTVTTKFYSRKEDWYECPELDKWIIKNVNLAEF